VGGGGGGEEEGGGFQVGQNISPLSVQCSVYFGYPLVLVTFLRFDEIAITLKEPTSIAAGKIFPIHISQSN
jgi:hypothetical protein